MQTGHRQHLGRLGERLAAEHFQRLGYRVLAQNHHTRWGELDLVLSDGRTLVFCEVKTRRLGSRRAVREPARGQADAGPPDRRRCGSPSRPTARGTRSCASTPSACWWTARTGSCAWTTSRARSEAVIARVSTFAVDGVTSRRVWVEADIRARGLPAFTVVGLADKAVREARERVRAALVNSGFVFPRRSHHGQPRAGGPAQDRPGLRPAAGGRAARRGRPARAGRARGLRGRRRAVADRRAAGRSAGTLAIAEGARRHGLRRLLVPRAVATEAALVPELAVLGAAHLEEAVAFLRGEAEPPTPQERGAGGGRGARAAGPRGRPRAQRADPGARGRRRGRPQPLPARPARHRQDDARPAPAVDPAAADGDRSDRGDPDPVGRRAARRRRARVRAPVPRAAPHDLRLGPRRRRLGPGARRGDARPPRRAVPRRAVGVRAAVAGGAAAAAGGRARDDRPRPAA